MSRILLADDSPHAQRMGERILREEGFEVVSVTDGDSAVHRLADADPDVIVADVFLPGKNGFELCRYVKAQPAHRHVRVVMTAGLLEVFDEDEARRAGADAIIKKPFEASAIIETIKPLLVEAQLARGLFPDGQSAGVPPPPARPAETVRPSTEVKKPETARAAVAPRLAPRPAAAPPAPIDPELVRAAVTVALDAAMPALIDDVTSRVLEALRDKQ
jgi:CheY-like chemotaxis protein